MSKIRQIRKEYGEPFTEVVKGFAEMGYSRAATARTLNLSLPWFRALCDRFDLHKHFKPQAEMRKDCRPYGGTGPGRPRGRSDRPGQKRPPKYSDQEILDDIERFPNISMFQAMSDISLNVVYRRFGSFVKARHQILNRPGPKRRSVKDFEADVQYLEEERRPKTLTTSKHTIL